MRGTALLIPGYFALQYRGLPVERYDLAKSNLGSESPDCKNVAMVLTHQSIGPASLVGLLIPGPLQAQLVLL